MRLKCETQSPFRQLTNMDFRFKRKGFVGGKLLPQLKNFPSKNFAAINFYLCLRITDGLHCCNFCGTKVARKFLLDNVFYLSQKKTQE